MRRHHPYKARVPGSSPGPPTTKSKENHAVAVHLFFAKGAFSPNCANFVRMIISGSSAMPFGRCLDGRFSSFPPWARGDTSAALRPRRGGVPLTPAVECFRGRRRRGFHYCGNRNCRVFDPAHTDRNGLTVRGDDCSPLIPYLVRERGRSRSISTGPWMTI